MMNNFAVFPSIRITLWILLLFASLCSASYMIGVGIADCTGPAAEIVFMGYAKAKQKGCGIHLRQFSRAFVFSDGTNTAAFVTVDAAMMAQGVRREVLARLSKINQTTIYNESNLILSGTHTHATPGGFLQDLMYDIPNFGFLKETFSALVNGITESIVRAHDNMFRGDVVLTRGELLDANINRSPASYLLNPEEERAKYRYNVDKEMVQLKLVRASDDKLMGAINWFAVHPTSMNNTNCLISSDNVGYASLLLEKEINGNAQIGRGPFVGAFASTNLGDVSPNIKGPRCVNTGEECDNVSSSCEGLAHFCIASGPGKDMFDSTKIIARRLHAKASELLRSRDGIRVVSGPLRFIHRYVEMPKQTAAIKLPDGNEKTVRGCLPAMGYSFAAGTTDGPGEFDFTQGTVTTNPFWNTIRDLIFPPTAEDVKCQHPKPILINTGRASFPYQWQAEIVPTQLLQVGDVILAAVPGEFTTMSGRRLRNAVKEAIMNGGGSVNTTPIITGLSNAYTSYITTPEEYRLQRYEGASTIYGPHTLTIYQKVYAELASALVKGQKLDPGPTPPDFSSKLISLVTPVFFDTPGWRRSFGDCILQPPEKAKRGTLVQAKFASGHPRNNFMKTDTFLAVERLENDSWVPVATDANWETKFIWERSSSGLGVSEVTVTWEIPVDGVVPGTHRIRHFGHYKYLFGGVYPYKGTTDSFEVT